MKINNRRLTWLIIIVILAFLISIGLDYLYIFFEEHYTYTEFTARVLDYVVTGIALLIWLSIVISSDQTRNKMPWLIILIFDPIIGLFLFLTVGRSFRRSDRYRSLPLCQPKEYLMKEPVTNLNDPIYKEIDTEITDIFTAGFNSTGHHPYLNDSRVEVLTNGEEKYPRLMKELQNAKSFVLMQYYIIHIDSIGKKVLEILKQKALNGVEVKIMYDSFGSAGIKRKYIKELKKSGIEVVVNDPVYFGFFNTRLNYRNHRKLTIIDGNIGFLGGLNLGDEYNQGRNDRFGYWRDTHLLLEGNVVKSMTQLFFRDWYYNTDEFIDDERYYSTTSIKEEGLIQIVPSGPEFKHPPIRNLYVKMINNAKKSIKIMTPYLALDQEMITSLVIAAKSGVDISIIIPGIADKKSVYGVTESFIEDLLEEGIKVYKYKKGFTHAKVFVIDDHLASCGTYNLDNRSARINFEVTALLYKQGVEKLVVDFEYDIIKSTLIDLDTWRKRGFFKRLWEGLLNIFSPVV